MKALDTNRRVLVWLCMCRSDEEATKREKIARIVFTLTNNLSLFSLAAGSVVFICENIAADFESSLFAFCQLCGVFGLLFMIMCGFVLRHQIADIFVSLQNIYDEGEYRSASQNDSFS